MRKSEENNHTDMSIKPLLPAPSYLLDTEHLEVHFLELDDEIHCGTMTLHSEIASEPAVYRPHQRAQDF